MSLQKNFTYWRRRIEETPGVDELDDAVRDAVMVLLESLQANPETYSELSKQVIEFISKKQDFGERKQRALKVIEPLAQINRAAALETAARALTRPVKPTLVAENEKDDAPKPNAGFEAAFTESLCIFFRERLMPWQITTEGSTPLPFILAPGFADVFEKAVRAHIIPAVLDNRRIRIMAQSMNMSEVDENAFMAEFEKPQKENVVRYVWENRWDNIKNTLAAINKAEEARKRDKHKKKSLLNMFKRDQGNTYLTTAIKLNEELEKEVLQVWDIIKTGAARQKFSPPDITDIMVYKALFEYEPDKIRNGMTGIRQMLRQEVSEGEGRDGSGRKFMCDLINKMPPHCGELLTLWAYFACPKDFSAKIQNSFVASQGTTVDSRRRRLPIFFRWVSADAGGIS